MILKFNPNRPRAKRQPAAAGASKLDSTLVENLIDIEDMDPSSFRVLGEIIQSLRDELDHGSLSGGAP